VDGFLGLPLFPVSLRLTLGFFFLAMVTAPCSFQPEPRVHPIENPSQTEPRPFEVSWASVALIQRCKNTIGSAHVLSELFCFF
jgi:hypothetical protein